MSDYFKCESADELLRKDRLESIASEQDLEIIEPSAYVLAVDLDSVDAVETFYERLDRYERLSGTKYDTLKTVSRNGNRHVYVALKTPMTILKRILLQTLLGSDVTRETLSCLRLEKDIKPVSVMFEKKKTAPRVRKFIAGATEEGWNNENL